MEGYSENNWSMTQPKYDAKTKTLLTAKCMLRDAFASWHVKTGSEFRGKTFLVHP